MSNPPSTTSSPRAARRAVLTGLAALTAIAGPVALVTATAGSPASHIDAEQTAFVHDVMDIQSQAASLPTRFGDTTPEISGQDATTTQADIGSVALEILGLQAPATTATTATTAAPTTTVPPAPPVTAAAAPASSSPAYGDPSDPATWDRLAQCEAGGNWATNTGNGYYGGLQFSASTWRGVGGTGLPHQNSRETQIAMGQRLQARSGWGQWPACTRKLGYR